MAKSKKARMNARGKRLAAKKSSASLKQDLKAPTLDQASAGERSSSYRLPSSSLEHCVEVFDLPAQSERVPLQHRTATSNSDDTAMTAKVLASVRSVAREVHDLIEEKKITTILPNIGLLENDLDKAVGTEANVSSAIIQTVFPSHTNHQESFEPSPDDEITATRQEISVLDDSITAQHDSEKLLFEDTKMSGASTSAPCIIVTNSGNPGPESSSQQLITTQETDERSPGQHAQHGKHPTSRVVAIKDATALKPELQSTNTNSTPITPVTPTFDTDHPSPTSSRSSFSGVHGENLVHQQQQQQPQFHPQPQPHHHNARIAPPRAAIVQPGRAIRLLGPSIMFGLFGGTLE